MTESERLAYNRAVAVCQQVIDDFSIEYVRRWGGNTDAKAAGWAILQAAAELRKVSLPADIVSNAELMGGASRRPD